MAWTGPAQRQEPGARSIVGALPAGCRAPRTFEPYPTASPYTPREQGFALEELGLEPGSADGSFTLYPTVPLLGGG